MKNLYSFFYLCVIFLVIQTHSIAQQKNEGKLSSKKSYWKAGMSYISDNAYLGRKDSVALPYLTPSFGYYHKSGLFITGALSYIPGTTENRIDLFTLGAGYSYATEKFNAEIGVSKEFYSKQSFNVSSEIKGRMDTYLAYDFGFIEPSIQTGINFAANPDFGIGIGLGHSFSMLKDKLEIAPAFLTNFATQNFNAAYYNKRRYSSNRKGKKQGNVTYDISADLSNATKFRLMDYEFGLPISYTIRKITLNFTPTYALPLNPSEVTLNIKPSNGNAYSKISSEKLVNIFYFSCGVGLKF